MFRHFDESSQKRGFFQKKTYVKNFLEPSILKKLMQDSREVGFIFPIDARPNFSLASPKDNDLDFFLRVTYNGIALKNLTQISY